MITKTRRREKRAGGEANGGKVHAETRREGRAEEGFRDLYAAENRKPKTSTFFLSALSASPRDTFAFFHLLAAILRQMAAAISLVPTAVGSSRCGFMS